MGERNLRELVRLDRTPDGKEGVAAVLLLGFAVVIATRNEFSVLGVGVGVFTIAGSFLASELLPVSAWMPEWWRRFEQWSSELDLAWKLPIVIVFSAVVELFDLIEELVAVTPLTRAGLAGFVIGIFVAVFLHYLVREAIAVRTYGLTP
jgi:hypothetical protein